MKITKPKHLRDRIGTRGHTTGVIDILPYLPPCLCFFDCRHFVVGVNEVPFAITTRTIGNCQQFLKVLVEYELNE